MGDTPERERSVPMDNVEEVKKKSKRKESRYGKRYGLEFKRPMRYFFKRRTGSPFSEENR